MDSKGIASWIAQVMTAFVAIGVIVLFYFLLYGRYFELHAMVESSEVQRHAINAAQLLLSSDKLVYEEVTVAAGGTAHKRYLRGVFDRTKLDGLFFAAAADQKYYEASCEKLNVGYPDSAMELVVSDVQANRNWVLSCGRASALHASEIKSYMSCMYNNIDWNILRWVFNVPKGPWQYWSIKECSVNFGSKIGTFEKDFPLMIKDGDSLHAGRLFIRLTE
ncbi:MAG: hypothetical protein ABIA12_02985 [Candidatus Aenigmatarchaeota archaeon]